MLKSNRIYIFLFKLFILVYIFIDFIRRFYEGNKFLLLSLDIVLIITILYFILSNNFKLRYFYRIPLFLRVFLFLFFMVVFLQIFNPWYFDIKTYIVGFRSYLLAIPIIFIGYYFSKYKLLLNQNMINFIIFFVIITFLFAIFQLMTDYTKLAGTAMSFIAPMEHGVHSYGDKAIQLTSSFFASSKRYGHFLIIMYLLYIGISLTIKNKISYIIILLFLMALIVSGSRESFVLFFLANILIMLKFMKFRFWLYFLISIILVGIIFFLYIPDDLLFKLEFLLSSPDEYLRRIYMFFPFFFVNFENPNMFFGLGVGKYGQESLLNENILNLTHGIDRTFFYNLDFFSNAYGFMDSGFSKIYIELGFIGMIIYLLLIVYIFFLAIKQLLKKQYIDKLQLTFAIWILLWIIYMMKAHPVISDIFMSYFLYFSIGYILFKEDKVEKCN